MSWELPIWNVVSWGWLLYLSWQLWRVRQRLEGVGFKLDDYAERQDIFHPKDAKVSLESEIRRLKGQL